MCHDCHPATPDKGQKGPVFPSLDNLETTGGAQKPQLGSTASRNGVLERNENGFQKGVDLPERGANLADVSKGDKPWNLHRDRADLLAEALMGISGMEKKAQRMFECGSHLVFHLHESGKYKLADAHFCRGRGCAICAWRKSLAWIARLCEAWPALVAALGGAVIPVMLTLTVPNCTTTNLRRTISGMNRAFHAMLKRGIFADAVVGFLRNTEITRGKGGDCHPHFHVLLFMRANYFQGENYITQAVWRELWHSCLLNINENSVKKDGYALVDGITDDIFLQVNIKKIMPKKGDPFFNGIQIPKSGILEVTKYTQKQVDIDANLDWYIDVLEQTKGLRLTSSGGVLKDVLKKHPRGKDEEPTEEELRQGDSNHIDNTDAMREDTYYWSPSKDKGKKRKRGYYRLMQSVPVERHSDHSDDEDDEKSSSVLKRLPPQLEKRIDREMRLNAAAAAAETPPS